MRRRDPNMQCTIESNVLNVKQGAEKREKKTPLETKKIAQVDMC